MSHNVKDHTALKIFWNFRSAIGCVLYFLCDSAAEQTTIPSSRATNKEEGDTGYQLCFTVVGTLYHLPLFFVIARFLPCLEKHDNSLFLPASPPWKNGQKKANKRVGKKRSSYLVVALCRFSALLTLHSFVVRLLCAFLTVAWEAFCFTVYFCEFLFAWTRARFFGTNARVRFPWASEGKASHLLRVDFQFVFFVFYCSSVFLLVCLGAFCKTKQQKPEKSSNLESAFRAGSRSHGTHVHPNWMLCDVWQEKEGERGGGKG